MSVGKIPRNNGSYDRHHDAFKSAYDNFSVELLKKCFDGKSNTLISPLSVSSALTMTANGANGQTKDEMEKVLGSGMPLDELNKYLSSFSGSYIRRGLQAEKRKFDMVQR